MKKQLLAVIGAAAIGVAVICGCLFRPQMVYARSLARADKLVEEGSWHRAVLTYKQAIADNPEDAEAYLKLADLYMDHDEMELAVQLLEDGFEKTGSARIKLALAGMNEDIPEEETSEAQLDQDLLKLVADGNYGSFKRQYGVKSCQMNADGTVTANLGKLECVFATDNGVNISDDQYPLKVVLKDTSDLFGGKSVSYDQLENLHPKKVGNEISFTAGNVEIHLACDGNGNIVSGEMIPLTEHEEKEAVETPQAAEDNSSFCHDLNKEFGDFLVAMGGPVRDCGSYYEVRVDIYYSRLRPGEKSSELKGGRETFVGYINGSAVVRFRHDAVVDWADYNYETTISLDEYAKKTGYAQFDGANVRMFRESGEVQHLNIIFDEEGYITRFWDGYVE